MIRLGYAAQNLTIPASTNRTLRLANLSDIEKLRNLIRENIHALLAALDGTKADVMVEAKGKEHALAPLGVEIG